MNNIKIRNEKKKISKLLKKLQEKLFTISISPVV